MPYRHGFLTKRLRGYLAKDRKSASANTRSVYDFHVRESLKQGLSDVVFVLEKMDSNQFHSVSEELYENIVRLLSLFSEKYCYGLDWSKLTYPFGIYREKRLQYAFDVFVTTPRALDIVGKITQEALDLIYGVGVAYSVAMPRNEYLDLRECIEKLSHKIIWDRVSEKKEEK